MDETLQASRDFIAISMENVCVQVHTPLRVSLWSHSSSWHLLLPFNLSIRCNEGECVRVHIYISVYAYFYIYVGVHLYATMLAETVVYL